MEFGHVPPNLSVPQLNTFNDAQQVKQDHLLTICEDKSVLLRLLHHQNIAVVNTPHKKDPDTTRKENSKSYTSAGTIFVPTDLTVVSLSTEATARRQTAIKVIYGY